MPWSALPKHIDEPKEWIGTDWWKNPLQRWMLEYKGWLAFGPRATEWWARWREYPLTIFSIKGKGDWRIEYTDGSKPDKIWADTIIFCRDFEPYYLSVIQYWCKWSFQIQWPLHVVFHWYLNEKDIPKGGERIKDSKNKILFFRIGARRDSDKVYWFPSLAITMSFN